MISSWLFGYLALGAVSGIFAGLLGVGGGTTLVPMLVYIFTLQALPVEHVMHLALGTSMATISFTSISSLRAHNRRGAVLWPVVYAIAPGVVAGTLLGSQFASHVATRPLAIFFAIFIVVISLQMLFNPKPKPSRSLPGKGGLFGVGAGIGGISSLVAIGGGSLSVPFLTWCNVAIHQAIGTSAAIGFPLAVSGAIGYILAGWQTSGLPPDTLGYVHLPALLGTVVASMLTAPVGAKIAHSLPVPTLKKIFSGVLMLLAAKMLHSLFG